MILNDYECTVCGHVEVDKMKPPRHCGKKMRKIYVPLVVSWKTPGCTRTVPFPEKKKETE